MAFAALVTVAVVFYSALLLRDTLAATREAVSKAEDGAKAAWAAVNTTQAANESALDSLATQNRAYVFVTHARINWKAEPFVEIRVHNAGTSPATAVAINMKIVRHSPGDETIARANRKCPHLIVANGAWEKVVPENEQKFSESAKALSDAAQKSQQVALEGTVTWRTLYDDNEFRARFKFIVTAASDKEDYQAMIPTPPRGRIFFPIKEKRSPLRNA